MLKVYIKPDGVYIVYRLGNKTKCLFINEYIAMFIVLLLSLVIGLLVITYPNLQDYDPD